MKGSLKAPLAVPQSPNARYWDSVAGECLETQSEALFRVHADAVNNNLFTRWLPEARAGRLLKTDLFDEAFCGGLTPLLASRGYAVSGVDVSSRVASAAQARYANLSASVADVRALPFADETFEAIVSDSTLDHFESPHQILVSLRELHRVLRRGGALLLTLDNPTNPVVALRKLLPFPVWRRLGLLRYYMGATLGARKLRRALVEAGFEVHEMGAVMHCPRLIAMPTALLLQKYAGPRFQKWFVRWLMSFERLSDWPTRFFTGHFVTAKARKR